jgi:hypothetical protein
MRVVVCCVLCDCSFVGAESYSCLFALCRRHNTVLILLVGTSRCMESLRCSSACVMC